MFASSLPFNIGPWKLGALPGIILEASDEKQEVVFSFEKIEKLIAAQDVRIALPESYIKTNQKDYDKILNAYLSNPAGFLAARQPERGMSVNMSRSSAQGRPASSQKNPTGPVINNKLELIKD